MQEVGICAGGIGLLLIGLSFAWVLATDAVTALRFWWRWR